MAKAKKKKDVEEQIETDEGVDFSEEAEDGSLTIDLSGVDEAGNFALLPRGVYPAVVSQVEYGMSQSSGNPMWTWQLEISEGEYAGRRFFYHTVFTEGGIPRVKRALSRLGQNELLENKFDPEEVANDDILCGLACQIRLNARKFEGEMRNNVQDLLAPAEGGGEGFEV